MKKISNKELKLLSKQALKTSIIVSEIPDALNQEIVREALIEMYETGYRYGEAKIINNG